MIRLQPLARALGVTLLSAAAAHAQLALSQADGRVQTAVPAQPLAQTLSALSRQAGIAIGADAALLRGKIAPAVHAGLSLQEALDLVLAGTGLVATRSGASAIAVQPTGAARAEATLAAVTVTASAEVETAAGPLHGYVAKRSTAGTKTDALLIETPQSISVVTHDELHDRQAQTLAQALGYTPGVTSQPTSFNRTADRFRIRGMDVESATGGSLRDGLRLQSNSYDGVQEPYGLERVEVVRGAASVLYGQLSPGGLINAVSKRPTSTPQHELGVQIGSHQRRQFTADFSGPLAGSQALDYRLTFLGRQSDTAQDFIQDDKIYLAPALTWRPTAASSLTLLSFYQKTQTRFAAPLPYQLVDGVGTGDFRIARAAFIGEPGYDEMNGEMYGLGYEFEHAFDERLKLSHRARYFKSDVTWNYLQAQTSAAALRSAAASGVLQRQYSDRRERPEGLATDTRLEWTGRHAGVAHKVLLGLDAYKTEYDSANFRGAAPSLDLARPAFGQSVTPVRGTAADRGSRIGTMQTGLYVQDQINFGAHWTAVLGLRHDWSRQDQTLRRNQAMARQDNEATTWRAGLVYKFANGMAPYASYSESFHPVSAADANGEQFKPTGGKQYEVGVRYQPEGRNMLLSAAVYELRQTNVLKYDAGQDAYRQAGEVRSRGLEFEAKAELTRHLDLIASYTYTDAHITRSTIAAEIGQRSEDTPYHQAALWLSYGLAQWGMPDLTIALGARYKGTTRASGIAAGLPAYTVIDALVNYRLDPQWDLSLNLANLANKQFTYCEFAICRYGDARQALGTLRYRW